MFKREVFMAEVTLQKTSVEAIAKKIGISKASFYRKMNGQSDFYRKEILDICACLHLDKQKMGEIFFDEKVS